MNRKQLPAVLAAILVLFSAVLFSGCDGSGNAPQIDAKAFPSGNVLSIEIPARLTGGVYSTYWGNQFCSDETFFEIQRRLSRDDCVSFAIRHAQSKTVAMRIDVSQTDGTKGYYLLSPVDNATAEGSYVFHSMRYRCYREQTADGGETGEPDYLLLPGFWLERELWQTVDLAVCYDTPYLCGPIEENGEPCDEPMAYFDAFYRGSGWYSVEESDYQLRVTPNPAAVDATAFLLSFSEADEQIYLTILPCEPKA